ncbi:MAG: hypothetical protein EPO29_02745 [Betaproteobacteria bacterium]|nr:MAG: hypothetical protein EPO29_02745 [Betaproteobacteria bacterium]
MHFMLLIFVVLLCLVVWGFFHSNPTGVPQARLLAFNVAILALAVTAGGIIGYVLYVDASVVKAGEKGLAVYLGIMAGGTAALIIVAAGGMLRNLVIFPLSRRERPTPGA